MVALLLEHGAVCSTKNNDGQTPLVFAAAQGHDAIVRLLLAPDAWANPPGPRCTPKS